ncbi:MAG: HAD family hydrolase, partial [Candidatus Hodarchaeales archaeon]
KGLIDEKEFWRRIAKGISHIGEIRTGIWIEAIKRAYSPKKEMFSLVTDLKRHELKIGILSNTEIPVVNFLSSMDYSIFDFLIYSCLEGMRKPEREIYLLAINRMGFKPEEIIFVDDSEENIQASQENGMHSILFTSPSQVKAEIEYLAGIVLKNDKY